MNNIIFLLEESSMKNTLQHILPKVLPPDINIVLIPHEGKRHLQKSIPIKLRGWRDQNTSFVILQDQDNSDCVKLKCELVELAENSRQKNILIRIVCRELESWFIGDFDAIEQAYGVDISKIKNRARYRNPDNLADAKGELKKIINYQPFTGSDRIARYMKIDGNHSHSFNVFIDGVRKLAQHMSC